MRGGRVVDPAQGVDGQLDIIVDHGIIRALRQPDAAAFSGETVDVTGTVVTPGWVDAHAHLRFPGFPQKETIASGTSAAMRGGFTTVVAMANTRPAVDSPAVMEDIHRMVAAESRIRVGLMAAVSVGLQGRIRTDVTGLKTSGAVGFSDDGNPVMDASLMEAVMESSNKLGMPVSVHEEIREAFSLEAVDPCWNCSGEVEMVRRDIDILARKGGHLHIAHVSCAKSVEMIADAKAKGLSISAECTPHHLTLDEATLTRGLSTSNGEEDVLPPSHGNAKVNPPLRNRTDIDALRTGLASGVLDVIATDHAPHSREEKAGRLTEAAFGFTGFELAVPLVIRLINDGVLSWHTAVNAVTAAPARIFGFRAGSLAIGMPADIAIIDPDVTWRLDADAMVGKGKNSPLAGQPLRGRPLAVIVAGKLHQFGMDHALRASRA